LIQYFKNINNQTIEIDKPENGIWVNLVPPLKEEEFHELSEVLEIPIEFLRDSLDIDERPRYELEDNVKFVVIKTPAENNSFNDSDAFYITIPICIILTHNHIVTVNSFDNGAIKKFLNTFQKRNPDKRNVMVLKIFEKVVKNFMDFLKDLWQFLRSRKKWWLAPLIIVLLLIGVLLVLGGGSAIAPFIYTLF